MSKRHDIKKLGLIAALGFVGCEFVAFIGEAMRLAIVSLFRRKS